MLNVISIGILFCLYFACPIPRARQIAGWSDDFESYVVGSFPGSGWSHSGNNAITVANDFHKSGTRSLRLIGLTNQIWGAVAHRPLYITPPFIIEFWVLNGSEPITSGNTFRAALVLNTGASHATENRYLVKFTNAGVIRGGPTQYIESSDLILGTYTPLQWVKVRIAYELPDESTLRLTYWIDGQLKARQTYSRFSYEPQLGYLSLWAGAGSAWFDDIRVAPTAGGEEGIAVSMGQYASEGGWISTYDGASSNYALRSWVRFPWSSYNATGGETHLALADLDNDGLDELIIGPGPGGGGWVAILDDSDHSYALLKWLRLDWSAYNGSIGAVFPAAGDIDGDGRNEIICGLGTGGGGWFEIFDDSDTRYQPIGWRQVAWQKYNERDGSTHPAIGDLDGDQNAEIILGLGNSGDGWLELIKSFQGNYEHRDWIRILSPNATGAGTATFPACGDLDGDGNSEIIVGLGQGGSGWVSMLDDAKAGYATLKSLQIPWTDYNNQVGETHPAVGDLNGDSYPEVVLGLGRFPRNGGWLCIIDNPQNGYRILNWKQVQWGAFNIDGGETFPAVGSFRY